MRLCARTPANSAALWAPSLLPSVETLIVTCESGDVWQATVYFLALLR